MGYKVDYDALSAFSSGIYAQVSAWQTAMETLGQATTALAETDYMSGNGADAVRTYVSNVHGLLQGMILKLLCLHQCNCLLYLNDYHTNIDTALHATIVHDELEDIKTSLSTQKNKAVEIDNLLQSTLLSISDLFSVSHPGVDSVCDTHQKASDSLTVLDDSIILLEASHQYSDFNASSELVNSLMIMIRDLLAQRRNYMTDFSWDAFVRSENFGNLAAAYLAVDAKLNADASAITTAMENESARFSALQEEYEQRKKNAETATWIVAGVVMVASVAVIVATGGAGTPLIVGAVSAAGSMVIAGTNNIASHYVEHGDFDDFSMGKFMGDILLAGAAGFATGYISAGLGGVITKGISGTAKGAALLKSSSMITRIGTNAAIGTVSEVASGVVARTASTLILTQSLEEAMKTAFNGKQILVDAVLGGANGAVDAVVSVKNAQHAADEKVMKYNTQHKPLDAGIENGLENLKPTKNNGVDFSESDYILKAEDGTIMEVKIKATGSRAKDYKAAEKILKEQGYDFDFKGMRTGTDATHVWHHMDDYDVLTNETTLQFITRDAHDAIENHAGSASQYHTAGGKGYAKQAFDPNYDWNILGNVTPSINAHGDTSQNVDKIESTVDDILEHILPDITTPAHNANVPGSSADTAFAY